MYTNIHYKRSLYLETEWCLFCGAYGHVVVEHLPQAQHSPSALHTAAKQSRADQNAATQASGQSWRGPACRLAFIQLAVFSKRAKVSKSARPTKKVFSYYLCWSCWRLFASRRFASGRPLCRLYSPFIFFLVSMRRPQSEAPCIDLLHAPTV